MTLSGVTEKSASLSWIAVLLWLLAMGAVLGLCMALQWNAPLIGVGGLIALASATVGAALGFLFAVPRVLSAGEAASSSPQAPGTLPAGTRGARLLGSNTNLERISDWLTTMLVGVGLSQLANVGPALTSFSTFLERTARVGPDNTAGALPAIGPALLILGLLSGFLYYYLQTRLVLVPELQKVEETLSGSARETVQEAAQQLAQQSGSAVTRQIASATLPSVEDAIEVMRQWLYQTEGYRRVIELAANLRDSAAAQRADFWFLVTAAYGQAHEHANEDAEKEEARKQAVAAARKAVELDATYKARLWSLTSGDGYDNDLATLRDDPELKQVLGVAN